MIWELDGVSVGHWHDAGARTGCTVVLFDPAVTASGEVRGSAPATRELALLDPSATVQAIDAVVLSGGSAFGLDAATGVVEWCEEHDRGVPTIAGRVPIVVAMSLFDLAVGDATVRPGAEHGRVAVDRAAAPGGGSRELGLIGVGTGATASKWRGIEDAAPAGLVGAIRRDGDLVVATLVAVNPWGDVRGAAHDGEPWPEIAPSGAAIGSGPDPSDPSDLSDPSDPSDTLGPTNTTIGVVVTNARLDKLGCLHVARGAHDGLARAITPPHSHVDGDAFVAAATGQVDAPVALVRAHAVEVVDEAIRSVSAHADLHAGEAAPVEGDPPERR